jgi:creatinine amidohydrolase
MRTRIMTSLTGYEVDEYLKRNDIIYIPVGPTEYNGGSPIDVEYVIPLAYAMKLAEKSDGLVFPYLAYFYPGGTTSGRATVMVTPTQGINYLEILTRSLIRQGFRRIVYLTSHGPSGATLQPVTREIYDELHVPVVWMDTGAIHGPNEGQRRPGAPPAAAAGNAGAPGAPAAGAAPPAGPGARNLITYGAYQLVGRLNDMPVGLTAPPHPIPPANTQSRINRLAGAGGVGNFYNDVAEHGGFAKAVTAEQREQYGREGAAMIEAQVAAFDAMGLVDAIRAHDEYTKGVVAKYGNQLPGHDVDNRH